MQNQISSTYFLGFTLIQKNTSEDKMLFKKEKNEVFAVILAGGSGTRFWPKSRQKKPKQLCKIIHPEKTMLELSLDRLDDYIPPKRRIIITHKHQFEKTKKIVGDRAKYIIAEPESKNTAAALALASLEVRALSKNCNSYIVSLHADHLIDDHENFQQSIKEAIEVAAEDYLVLMGIKPSFAETGYGYIEKDQASNISGDLRANRVKKFHEKPNKKTAELYFSQSHFLWNSGIFVWKTNVILNEFEKFENKLLNELTSVQKNLGGFFHTVLNEKLVSSYQNLANISIDHALLEKSDKIAVIEALFTWHDIGSWSSVDGFNVKDEQGNSLTENSLAIKTKNCTIRSENQFVATVGTKDLIIIVENDAILICDKNNTQDVKKVVENLKIKKDLNYLI